MSKEITILLIENSADDANHIREMLAQTEYSATALIVTGTVDEAVGLSHSLGPVAVVLLDAGISDADPVEHLRRIRRHYHDSAIIILTSQVVNHDMALESLREGAQNYVTKAGMNSYTLGRVLSFSIERNANIVKLKNAYKALQLSEQRFSKLFRSNPVAAMSLTTVDDGTFVEANEIFYKLLGVTREDVIGNTSKNLNLWLDINQRERFVAAIKRGDVVKNEEVKMRTRSGKIVMVLFSMELIDMETGPMIMSTASDITDRVESERKLRESQRHLHTLINSTSDQIWLVNPSLALVMGNHAFYEAVHKARGGDIRPGDPVLHPGFSEPTRQKWEALYRRAFQGNTFTTESSDSDITNANIHIELTLNPVYDEQRNVIGVGCFCRDITLRKQAEQKLREANERYRIVSMATNDATLEWDMINDTLVWNQRLYTIFGYNEDEIVPNNRWWFGKIHPDDSERILGDLEKTIAQKESNWSSTYRIQCADGSYKYVFGRGHISYSGGKPIRMLETIQDIDNLMKATDEIRNLSLVASKTDSLVLITDAQERIEWVNESFIKTTGYTLGEIAGKKSEDFLVGPETDRFALERMRRNLAAGIPVSEEVLNYTKDGRKFWLKKNINPVFNNQGAVIKFISVETDISIHKEYEKNITAIARELSVLIENANAIIFGFDRNGYVNEWNKVAVSATGFTKSEALEKKVTRFLIEPENHEKGRQMMDIVLKGNPVSLLEFPIVNRNGDRHILLLSATPRRNASGEIVGVLVVGQDITELTQYRKSLEEKVKERTQELKTALEKEKELVTLKSRFASMVSHEFRTPLSTIRLAANYIRRYRDRLDQQEIDKKINTIQHQVDHMTHLLEDVLTLGKSEEGKLQISRKKVDLDLFFENIKDEVENMFRQSHTIHYSFDTINTLVDSDEDLLRNIFINLLSNAIKFSPGKDEVSLKGHQEGGNLIFEVADRGIGIQEGDLEKIFMPFDRGSNAGAIPGTGLGLSIVKKAVELLSGSIKVDSPPGKGSVFTVTIPLN
jgi:PAS domain S-box-containing protein